MKATPAHQNELIRLQSADSRLQYLVHAAAHPPQNAELKSIAPEVDAVRVRWIARTGELEDARTELSRIESDVAVVEARMTRDSDRVQHTSSAKDAQALEGEIASLRKRRDALEEIELAVMERIEIIEGALSQVAEERAVLAARVDGLEAARGEEVGRLEAQRAALTKDRAAIAETIPEDLLALYEKQRGRYGIGAALLVRGVSLGSNVALTGSDLEAIRRAAPDDVVLCPDSGAILIRNEESGL